MKPEDRLLLACARQKFQAEHRQQVFDLAARLAIDWPTIYTTAELHDVAPLIYTNLWACLAEGLPMPPEITAKFKNAVHLNLIVKEKIAHRLKEAIAFFRQHTLEVMLIKGAALDILVYEQPWYTRLNDVDLVLSRPKAEVSEAEQQEFMRTFHQTGFEFDYFEHHDIIMNGILPLDFKWIWQDARQIDFMGQPVWVMSPEDMLIAACINSCRKRFFRLKSLCDIAGIIYKNPNLDLALLVEKARRYDCHNIVYAALFVTQLTVGLDLPPNLLDQLGVNRFRAGLIRSLSRQMSHQALPSLYSGQRLLARSLDWPLLLPYSTFQAYQIRRKLAFIRQNGT